MKLNMVSYMHNITCCPSIHWYYMLIFRAITIQRWWRTAIRTPDFLVNLCARAIKTESKTNTDTAEIHGQIVEWEKK